MFPLTRTQSVAVTFLASIGYALPWTYYLALDNPLGTTILFSTFFLTAFVPLQFYAYRRFVSPLILLGGYSVLLVADLYWHGLPHSLVGYLFLLPLYLVVLAAFAGIEYGIRSYVRSEP